MAKRTLHFHDIVGKGGFGTVYRATYESGGGFQKEVAVKILKDAWSAHEIAAPRLRDEARLLGLLRHRSIPNVDGLFWLEGHCALVVEYIQGASLLQVAKTHPLPVGVAIEVCAEVAAGLHVAYNKRDRQGNPLNLVHRDIKPANIQLTTHGEVKLLDFGIARADFAQREAETSRILLGSVTYMAPERLDMISGPEGDIYALGITIAEAVAAKKFGKTSANKDRHLDHIEKSLRAVANTVDDPDIDVLLALVRNMLQYEPEDRPTAKELEKRCRDLRQKVSGPWLADWAEDHVGSAMEAREDLNEDAGTGRWLGRTVGVEDAAAVTPAGVPQRAAGSGGAALGRMALLLVPMLLLAMVGLVGVVGLAWWASSGPDEATDRTVAVAPAPPSPPLPAPAEPGPATPDPVPDVPDPQPVEDTDDGVAVVAPAPSPTEPGPVAPRPSTPAPPPQPAPAPAPATGGPAAPSPVSASAFGTWVASNPDWSQEAATAAGRADDNYLRGWDGATPPAGQAWAVNVSWYAAAAYCSSRGGLAGIDAEPATWASDTYPFQEYRQKDGRAAWRRFDGAISDAVRRADANAFTGFRCTR